MYLVVVSFPKPFKPLLVVICGIIYNYKLYNNVNHFENTVSFIILVAFFNSSDVIHNGGLNLIIYLLVCLA